MDISVVIPLLNEEESLVELEEWIRKVMIEHGFSYEIVFVDDGSRDKSWSVIEKLKQSNPNIKGIKFRRNYGKSPALNIGFGQTSGDVVITMDADLQDSPDEIPDLYRLIKTEGYHLISGWKQKRYDPITKTLPTKLFNWATRKMSGIYLHDFNCGLKAYDQEVIKNIEVYGEMHRYIPVLAKWAGFDRIGEKIVQHQPRKYGQSKFGLSRFINGFLDLLSLFFVGKFGKRPMHFFGSIGTFMFFIGILILLYLTLDKVIWNVGGIADRPLFYFGILTVIVGSQLFLTGFIAEMLARLSDNKKSFHIEKTI